MKEIIKQIKEIFNFNGMDGYEIITDKQSIKFLIKNQQQCCESFGYIISEDDFIDYINSELISISLTDSALNKKVLDEVNFDMDCGDVIFVNIETSKGLLQFAAYNAHNGYYSHKVMITSNQLNIEEYI